MEEFPVRIGHPGGGGLIVHGCRGVGGLFFLCGSCSSFSLPQEWGRGLDKGCPRRRGRGEVPKFKFQAPNRNLGLLLLFRPSNRSNPTKGVFTRITLINTNSEAVNLLLARQRGG